jgi:hypothetical protein
MGAHEQLRVDLIPQYLTSTGFSCISRFFLFVNARRSCVLLTNESEFVVLNLEEATVDSQGAISSEGMIGLDYIWHMVLEIPNQAVKLLADAVGMLPVFCRFRLIYSLKYFKLRLGFLNQLHEKLCPELLKNVGTIRQLYIKKCFGIDALVFCCSFSVYFCCIVVRFRTFTRIFCG